MKDLCRCQSLTHLRRRTPLIVAALLLFGTATVQAQHKPLKPDCPLGEAGKHVILAYPFEKDGGLRTIDVSGADFHGEIRGASYTTAGYRGGGLRFFGDWDCVKVSPLKLREFTFAAWVQSDTDDVDNRILFLLRGSERFFSLQGNSSGGVGVVVTGGKEVNEYEWSLTDRGWVYLAVTYDGYTVNIYRNGVLTETRRLRSYTPIVGNLFIGGGCPKSKSWCGVMDDITVANRMLTGDEISMLYKKTVKPVPPRLCSCPMCWTSQPCTKPKPICPTIPCVKPKSEGRSKPSGDKKSTRDKKPVSKETSSYCEPKPVCRKTVPCNSRRVFPKKNRGPVVVGEIMIPPVVPLKPMPNTESLTIEAFVEDISDLWLKHDGILWKNVTHTAKPGRGDDRNEPTWLAGYPWYPVWNHVDQSKGIDLSNLYALPLRPGKYQAELLASGTSRAADTIERGTIEAIPIKGSLVVRFVDPEAGPGWYRIRVTRLDAPVIW